MLQTVPQIKIFDDEPKLTKSQKRALKRKLRNTPAGLVMNTGLKLKTITPLTANQRRTFEAYAAGHNLLLTGCAGTGKTFLSFYLSLQEILSQNSPYKRLVIYRSVVPTRDMGFLPGKAEDKTAVYEAPYVTICNELFGRGDAYEILKKNKYIEFESTSFVRGTTQSDCIIIVDECQNMNPMEIHSVFTRVGDNAKIMFCGDLFQNDLKNHREKTGLADFMKILNSMNSFGAIEFQAADICRSKLVKDYILARMKLEREGKVEALV